MPERMEAFRRAFVIPREKLDTVFAHGDRRMQGDARQRHLVLPPGERFTVESVVGQAVERIQLVSGATTAPDPGERRAADLHRSRGGPRVSRGISRAITCTTRCSSITSCASAAGWSTRCIRCSARSRSSPRGARTTASRWHFPAPSAWRTRRAVLFPLAGLDAVTSGRVLRRAGADARADLRRQRGRAALSRTARSPPTGAPTGSSAMRSRPPSERAQRVRFFDTYRSYVINYNLGQDLVKAYVERAATAEERWRRFGELLSTPRLPSDLAP